MDEHEWLAERFEAHRTRLRKVAYRILGSTSEADDAIQEAWLRLSRSDSDGIENLGGWLTTVVARVCLSMLQARREEPVGVHLSEPVESTGYSTDPEHEALLADSIGPALQVILHTLAPAERLAFVLHDMFAVPFEDIATIVGRSPAAARQLASRARRRVQGATVVDTDLTQQRATVDAFLTAARDGDFDALLDALDPDVVVRSDGAGALIRGAAAVAGRALAGVRSAEISLSAVVDGAAGVVLATDGRPIAVLAFTITRGKIVAIDITGDPDLISQLELTILGN